MRYWLARYIRENWDDLLALDLKAARVLGIPAPHTLSSWAYAIRLSQPFWWHLIDQLAWWLLDEEDHCEKDYNKRIVENVSERPKRAIGEDHSTKPQD